MKNYHRRRKSPGGVPQARDPGKAASVPSGSSGSRRAFYAEGIDLWEDRWIEARGCRWIVAPAETLRFDMVICLYIDFRYG